LDHPASESVVVLTALQQDRCTYGKWEITYLTKPLPQGMNSSSQNQFKPSSWAAIANQALGNISPQLTLKDFQCTCEAVVRTTLQSQ